MQYKLTHSIISYCISTSKVLNDLTIEEFKNFSDMFNTEIFHTIDISQCVNSKSSYGDTGRRAVNLSMKKALQIHKNNIEIVEELRKMSFTSLKKLALSIGADIDTLFGNEIKIDGDP